MNLAPIGLSTYTRLSHLKKTVEALKSNTLAQMSELFVFSDAPKSGDENRVMAVRRFVESIKGFRRVHIVKRKTNSRIKNSRDGISKLLEEYEKCIFLEEDIVTAPGFLVFMNEALNVFEDKKQIFSVSGYKPPLEIPEDYSSDAFIIRRACGWGIGLWRDRYKKIKYLDPAEVRQRLSKKGQIEELTEFGEDLLNMVLNDATGKIDALDVKIFYHQFLNEKYTIYPRKSLVLNIGHDGSGVHCKSTNKFNVDLWNKEEFNINKDVKLDYRIVMSNYRFRQVSDSLKAIKTSNTLWQKKCENEKTLGKNLIFLISQPRAGSTLLQRIFSGHPEIHTTAEPWLMLHPVYALKENGIETEYNAETARQGLADYLMQVPESIDLYKSAIRKYGNTLYNRALEISGKRLFLDKTPRYYHIIPELHNIFPEAKFIILLRNPLAVLSSVLKTWCHNRVDNIHPSYLIDLVKGPVCLINGIKILKEDAIVVDYESLVQNPRKVMKRVSKRLGITFYEGMIHYGGNPIPKGRFGDSVGIFKHDRPVTQYIDKWQMNFVSKELLEYAEKYLTTLGLDVVTDMGYNFKEIKEKLYHHRKIVKNTNEKNKEKKKIKKEVITFTNKEKNTGAELKLKKDYDFNTYDAEKSNHLGLIYQRKCKNKKSIIDFQKAIELNPEKIKFQKSLAEYYYNNGDKDQAIKMYTKLIRRNQNDLYAILKLAKHCIDIKKYDESFIFCQKALELCPTILDVRDIMIELGKNYELTGNMNKAREVYLYYLLVNTNEKTINKKWIALKDNDKEKKILKKAKAKKGEYIVSAIVSTYNSEEFISGCIDNLESQTFNENLEIVVVDADSKQNEEKIIKRYQNKYHNITYLKTHKRIGIYTAWNIAVKEASGKYLISASTNDNLRKDACEILSTYLDKNPECMLVYGDTYLTKTPHQCFEDNTHEDVYKWPRYSFKEHLHSCLIGPHPMWRKEIHSKIGYFDEKYRAVGDQEFWLRIGENNAIKHLPEFTGLQWVTEDAISRNGILPHLEVLHIQKKYQKRNAFPKTKKSFLCSIIIPVFNQLEYTKQCIAELYKYTPNALYELIIIDNNSTDGTKEYLSGISEIYKVVRNKDNFGYAKACNQGAKLAVGKFLVFLNNDTVPTAGWLESLIDCAQSDEEVGIVGSKLLYPDGTIQHAGIEIINGIPDHPLRHSPGDAPEANVLRELDMVTGACVLIKKEIFAKCRGFDEKYRNGVEDVDLCLKVRNNGYKVIYNPKSTLFHHEGKTAGRFDHVRENLEIFYQRWGKRFDKNGKFIQNTSDETLQVIWEGSQFVNHSLALVNREMCIELCNRKDIELSIIPYEPHKFGPEQDPERYYVIQEHLNMPLSSDANVHIRHQWPPKFTPPKEGHWIMIQPWEYGALPKDWVEPMRSQVDELWVPSNYVREVYVNSGIPASKVFVIPNGVDYGNFHLQAKPKTLNTEKTFKFLFVGGTIPRKGIDVLLDAYTSAFNRSDDVCLVIKDMGVGTFYRGQSATERIMAIQKDVEAPEILYLKEYLTDKHMAGLYTACDLLVHPYRGEGFGLPVAEAMACGLPVLVTRGGACDDFCNDNNSLPIESKRRPIVMNDSELCDTGWVLEPNKDDLIRSLRFIYENKDEGRKIGAAAAREIRELVSWEKSADLVVQRIKELKNKPIIRLQVNEYQKSNDNNNSDLIFYSSIQEQVSNGDIEGAIANLEDLVGNKPELAVAYNDLGVLYHRQGKNTLALTHYRRAVDFEPGKSNFRKNLADLLSVTFGELEEALQHYVAVLASDPKDVEALSATGHICARLERYDDAAEFYERILEIEPNNSDAANWRAKMLEKKYGNSLEGNLNDRYLALLSEIDHEDLSGAIQIIENFIEMYPKHGQAHNDLGVLYYKNEFKTKVLASYLKAVELEPENVTFRKNLADFLYVEEGRVEEALENYVEVLRIKPDDVETLLVTGHICTSIDRYEDAMSFYKKVLNIEPGNLDARKNLEVLERRQISMLLKEERGEEKTDGAAEINQAEPQASVDELTIVKDGVVEELINKAELLFQQERIDQAVDAMLKAIAVNQLDGRTYIELARQLINHGSNENALEVLAEMPANQPEALEKQKLVLEGYCQEGMGNYAAAKKCNDGVLACEPKNTKALNLNGILAYRNGDKETAEQHFKRAIELDSEYGEPHTNLGALVWENGKPKMALEHYERGFSISPTDIDVANAYHEAATATGEYKRAEKAARSALKKYPQCRKVLYLLVDTLIRQKKNEEALKELENALSTFGVDEGLLDTALAFRERVGKIKKTGSDKKPGVSLCMIVKDEEDNLARCLASVKPIVDEMIVVDTGSTDRTRDIAEFLGARVYDFEWKDDFAEARNFSLSKAKGGWILILDADEVISSKDYVKFQSIVRRRPKKPIAYSITTRNYCTLANTIGWETNLGEYPAEEAGFGWLPSAKVRLFYGRSRVRFEGAVHEMVDPALKRAHIPVKSCHIPVHHYGRLDTEKMNKKGKIYYDLGRRKLEESNCDHAAVRELATQATILGKNEEAVDLWHRFLKMSPPDRAIAEAHVNLATLYLRLQDYKEARNISEKVLSKVPEMKEARYNLALSELYLGNPGRTVEVLECMVKDHPLYPPAQFILAATCFINGKKEQSESLLENLKKGPFGPVLTRSFAELVRDLNAAGRFDYAQQLLGSALENKIVDAQILTQLSLTLPNSPQPVAVAG